MKNYTDNDLETFLGLPVQKPYTKVEMDKRVVYIREILLGSGHVDMKFKADLMNFLEKTKERLHKNRVIINEETDKLVNRKPTSLGTGHSSSSSSSSPSWKSSSSPSSTQPSSHYTHLHTPAPFQARINSFQANQARINASTTSTTSTSTTYDDTTTIPPSSSSQNEALIHTPNTAILFESEDHMLKQRPFPILNPNEKRFTTKLICIDTLFRENYANTSPSSFVYKLSTAYTNVVSMKMSSIEIPFYWYSISSKDNNNSFQLTISNLVYTDPVSRIKIPYPPMIYDLVIPDGNYKASQVAQVINNIFLQNSTANDGSSTNGLNFITCAVNQITLKTIFRACDPNIELNQNVRYPFSNTNNNAFYSPDFTIQINFDNNSTQRDCYGWTRTFGWTLGFRQPQYIATFQDAYTSVLENLNYTYLSTYSNDLKCYICSEMSYGSNIDNYCFVAVEDYHNNYPTDTISMINKYQKIGKNILGRITLAQGFNSVIIENNADFIFRTREYFGPVDIEKLHITMINRFGETLAMNQQDFSLVLELKIIYS
jgi:hypothetical protein